MVISFWTDKMCLAIVGTILFVSGMASAAEGQQSNVRKLRAYATVFSSASDAMHYYDLIVDSPKGDNTASNYFNSLVARGMARQMPSEPLVKIVDRLTGEYYRHIIKVQDATSGQDIGWTYTTWLEKEKKAQKRK